MTSLAIDASDVTTANVSGAFLHGIMDNFVLVRQSEEEVQAMTSVDPKYKEFVLIEAGKMTMYLRLKKALYGTLKTAIIWYNTFTGVLKNLGFVLSDYDNCEANLETARQTLRWKEARPP